MDLFQADQSDHRPLKYKSPPIKARPELEPWLAGWTVLLFMRDTQEIMFLSGWVSERGGAAIRVHNLTTMLEFLEASPREVIVMVEVTEECDLNQEIENCLRLRNIAPSCPIILLSSSFKSDELSTLRLEICDASVRLPILKSAFEDVVLLAVGNNVTYLQRKNLPVPVALTDISQQVRCGTLNENREVCGNTRAGWWLGPFVISGIIAWVGIISYFLELLPIGGRP